MASRFYDMVSFQLEKNVVRLYARVTFGASGAPTLDLNNSKGVLSVTRNSTGKYTFVLGTNARSLDQYVKILSIQHSFDETGNAGTAPAAPSAFLVTNAIKTTASFALQFNASGTATDPASGEAVWLQLTLGNSTAY